MQRIIFKVEDGRVFYVTETGILFPTNMLQIIHGSATLGALQKVLNR